MAELKPDDPEVVAMVQLEHELQQLVSDPTALKILKLKEELDEKIAQGWKRVQGMMELSHTKKVSGDWGYVTLVERTLFTIDPDTLPPKFWKKVPDTKLIGDTYKLTHKVPKGATPVVNMSLRKSIK